MTSVGAPVQRFSFGYHLNTWDLSGLPLDVGIRAIRDAGFPFVEALARDGFSNDFARRFMDTGPQPTPQSTTDIEFLRRIRTFADGSVDGLQLASLYCNREFINPVSWVDELDTLVATLYLLNGFGAPGLVVGGGPAHHGAGDHDAAAYDALAAALHDIGRRAADLDMWVAYHPHIDCFIETRQQLDKLMDRLDTSVAGLCIDTAHLQLGASDPVAALRDYAEAVRYVHFKDVVDPSTVRGPERFTAFRALGDGVVDLRGCVDALLETEYDGIVIIELDTTPGDGMAELRQSTAFVRDLGLELAAPQYAGPQYAEQTKE